MSGSRFHKIGTIYTRAKGLLTSGAWSPAEKPLWYDVYEAFPPRVSPSFNRVEDKESEVKKILYPEDIIRAKFYKKYPNHGTFNLNERVRFPTVCNVFVQEYTRIEKELQITGDELMEETVLALEGKGIYLDRTRRPDRELQGTEEYAPIDSELLRDVRGPGDSKINLSLSQMFSDQIDQTERHHLPPMPSATESSTETKLDKEPKT